MLKTLTIFAFLAFVHSEEQTQDDNTVEITLVNYSTMYDNECAASSTSSSASPDDEGSKSDDDDDGENKYEEKYDKYYKKYEDKYAGEAEKYEKEYDGPDSPGSVPDNEMGGDDDSNSENQETSTFCKCLAEVKKEGKSYADSQNDFSKCIDEANGNDASHWEKVAKEYEHKYGVKTGSSWDSKVAVPQTADEDTPAVPADADADAADNADNTDNADDADNADNTENTDNTDNADNAENVDGADDGDQNDEALPPPVATEDDATALVAVEDGDNRLGNAGIYLTFIGASILLFICAWFIKDGLKKFKLREYQFVDQSSCYESEADADKNGNPYGGGDDDWDDQYNSNYSRNNDKGKKKGKFSGWNQYSAV